MNKLKKLFAVAVPVVAASVVSVSAQAAGLADITDGLSVTDVLAGIVAVATLVGGVLMLRMGAKKVLGMIK